jgi:hypothetical protein
MAGRRALRAMLSVKRRFIVPVVIVATVSLLAVIWIVKEHALRLLPVTNAVTPANTTGHIAATAAGLTVTYVQQMIGVLAALDTWVPSVTFYVWYMLLGLLIFLGLASTRGRLVMALVGTTAAVVAIPIILTTIDFHKAGYGWQGRYDLPLAVGIPFIAAVIIDQEGILGRFKPRVCGIIIVAVALGQLVAFVGVIRRYAEGSIGPIDFLRGDWQPPLGDVGIITGMALSMALLSLLIWRMGSHIDKRTPNLPHGGTSPLTA